MGNASTKALRGFFNFFKRISNRFGYDMAIVKHRFKRDQYTYSAVFPSATYSPWYQDEAFQKIYSQVTNNTLVDIYRCYELWQLVGETNHLPGAILEVGVWRGGSGMIMAQRAKASAHKTQVYLCDTFEGVVKAGAKDGQYVGGEHKDTSEDIVKQLRAKLQLDHVHILKGIFPDDTHEQVTDQQFRLCHIDVDVYDSAQGVYDWVWNKLVVGGMIVFDDFGFPGTNGVTQFVEEQRAHQDRLVMHNLNGHGIIVKLS